MKALAIFSAAAIVAMAGCSASSGSGGSSPASGGGGGGASSHAASGPVIGSKVRDGKFEFVITRVSHRASVGNTTLGLGTKAQGRFTELHLKVTNIGSESQTLDDSSQYVFDANGRKFSADSSWLTYLVKYRSEYDSNAARLRELDTALRMSAGNRELLKPLSDSLARSLPMAIRAS
jgi:hypothetical protein